MEDAYPAAVLKFHQIPFHKGINSGGQIFILDKNSLRKGANNESPCSPAESGFPQGSNKLQGIIKLPPPPCPPPSRGRVWEGGEKWDFLYYQVKL